MQAYTRSANSINSIQEVNLAAAAGACAICRAGGMCAGCVREQHYA